MRPTALILIGLVAATPAAVLTAKESPHELSAAISMVVYPPGYTELSWSSQQSHITLVANADLSALPIHWSGTAGSGPHARSLSIQSLDTTRITPGIAKDLLAPGDLRPDGLPQAWPLHLPRIGSPLSAILIAGNPTPDDLDAIETLLADFESNAALYRAEQARQAAAIAKASPAPANTSAAALPRFLGFQPVSPQKAQQLRQSTAHGTPAPPQ